jgi:SAM-dependent methyltransferase
MLTANYFQCPCCRNQATSDTQPEDNYVRYRCANCRHEFFRPTSGQLGSVDKDLYEQDADYSNDLHIAQNYRDLVQWNHIIASRFITRADEVRTVLDGGAYNGFFVKYLREEGLEAYGCDFNARAIQHGKQVYGLEHVIVTDVADLHLEKIDCVTAFEVIEHIEKPREFLEQFGSYIRDGGYLILSCPNSKMVWRPPLDYPPHHLSRYSPTSLRALVESCGYDTIAVFEQMKVFDLVRNFIGVLFRDNTKATLKGGQFRQVSKVNRVKAILNRSRRLFYLVSAPIDSLLHSLGVRYISQVIIARKKCGNHRPLAT